MNPKEKAKELVEKFDDCLTYLESKSKAKQCALISVDEILNIDNIKPYILHKEIIEYWKKVKQEINKL
jgi:hypothetical protein